MTTEATNPPAQPAATPPTATPQPQAPAAGQPAVQQQPVDPNWLNGRIAQAKKSAESDLFKKLGVKDEAELASRLGDAKKLEDEKKSDLEKRDGKIKELEPKAARAEQLEKTVAARAERELADLTEEQRAAVKSLAGEDPAKVLETIDALKPTWKAQASAAGAQQPKPAPASTTGAAPPPTPATPPAPVDHLAVYDDLKTKNPMMASHYLETYGSQIAAAREAKRKQGA